MRFELLKLYRNYRNIENMCIDNEHSMVLGHFDSISTIESQTADHALDTLYETLLDKDKEICADVQPMILFSYDDKAFQRNNDRFKAISFLQIKNPLDSHSVHDFYLYVKDSVDKIVSGLSKENAIKNVCVDVYIPFSFMNAAIIIYADNLTDICTVVKNIIYCKLADFQYSVLSFPESNSFPVQNAKNINLSLRFIWKEDVDTAKLFKELEEKVLIKFAGATTNQLLGNNDCLLHIPNSGYEIISMMLSPKGTFKDFLSSVENTRATISFPSDSIRFFDFPFIIPTEKKYIDDSDESIINKEKYLFECLDELKEDAPDLLKRDVNDIIYRVAEFSKFISVIRKHAKKGIASTLYLSIKEPYELFLEMSADRVKITKSVERDNILEIIGNILNEMSNYFGNIFHCNLGFFEERGFYNNIIGLASNIELAYNKYANCICKAILSDKERNDDKLDIRCSVTSDKEPLICTTDIFEKTITPENEEKSLVKVNIPVSYVFKYDFVSKIIIHEIAHHVGGRNRDERLESIGKCLSAIVADPIVQLAVIYPKADIPEEDILLIKSFEQTEIYNEMHYKMKNEVLKIVENCVSVSVIEKCDKPYFMDDAIKSIYYTLNKLPENNLFFESLAEVISDFQFDYFNKLEDYFFRSNVSLTNDSTLFFELSALSIKAYNKEFLKKKIKRIVNCMITPEEVDYESYAEELNCYIYIPDMEEIIEVFCEAVSEAYCDLMMITLFKMTFDDYITLLSEYGKTIMTVVNENDFLTWIRIEIVAKYFDCKPDYGADLPERFSYIEDLGLYDIIMSYFKNLKSEFEKAFKRSRDDLLLSSFIDKISSEDEEDQIEAIFDMYYGIFK